MCDTVKVWREKGQVGEVGCLRCRHPKVNPNGYGIGSLAKRVNEAARWAVEGCGRITKVEGEGVAGSWGRCRGRE